MTGVRLNNLKTGEKEDIPVMGVFIAIGHSPNTKMFEDQLEMNHGYIVTKGIASGAAQATNLPGVFAAGDCRTKKVRQIATAISDGASAALAACSYIENN